MDSETPNKTELKPIKERLARRMLELQEMDKVIRDEIKDSKVLDIELEECLDFQDKVSYISMAIDEFLTDANATTKSVSTFQSVEAVDGESLVF